MRTRFIVNPMANKGGCGKRWPQIRAELENTLGPLAPDDVAMTRARNHATTLASEAVGAGYRRLVAIGGDGTFSEVLNGVIVDDRPIAPDLVLAQVPGGTSNELSRSFGQRSLADASRAVASGQRARSTFSVPMPKVTRATTSPATDSCSQSWGRQPRSPGVHRGFLC